MSSLAHLLTPRRQAPRQISFSQQRWPTAGWLLGELRWYLFGGLVSFMAFIAYVLAHSSVL